MKNLAIIALLGISQAGLAAIVPITTFDEC
jgi:hypothetical protein